MIEVLEQTLQILKGGRSWCKGNPAIDSHCRPCNQLSASAVKWDLQGALLASSENWQVTSVTHVLLLGEIQKLHKFYTSLAQFNDAPDTTWKTVRTLVTDTIKTLKEGQGDRAQAKQLVNACKTLA